MSSIYADYLPFQQIQRDALLSHDPSRDCNLSVWLFSARVDLGWGDLERDVYPYETGKRAGSPREVRPSRASLIVAVIARAGAVGYNEANDDTWARISSMPSLWLRRSKTYRARSTGRLGYPYGTVFLATLSRPLEVERLSGSDH